MRTKRGQPCTCDLCCGKPDTYAQLEQALRTRYPREIPKPPQPAGGRTKLEYAILCTVLIGGMLWIDLILLNIYVRISVVHSALLT